jgi:hypothetical protein
MALLLDDDTTHGPFGSIIGPVGLNAESGKGLGGLFCSNGT